MFKKQMFTAEESDYARNCEFSPEELEVLKVIQLKRIADSVEQKTTKELFEIESQGYKRALCEIADAYDFDDEIEYVESDTELFDKIIDNLDSKIN